MVAALAKWLVRRRLYRFAGWTLTMASFLIGKRNKIRYNKNGYWTHLKEGWKINEAFPDIRMDIKKIRKFNHRVYFHEYLPKPGDTVIDVGAGIGSETIFISKEIGEKGNVFAIEASPATFRILEANIKDNDLKNVHTYNIAIAGEQGKINISANPENHIGNSILEGGTMEVDAVTMDEFFLQNKINSVQYLKVNIEGAEKLLVLAFELVTRVQHIAISCHDFLGKRTNNPAFFTKDVVTRFLQDHGFQISSRNIGTDYEDDWIYATNNRHAG